MQGRDLVVSLIVKHRNALYAFILAAVRDPDLTEDVLQDVSVAICSAWERYDPARPFMRWARAVARNRVRDILRKRGHRKEILDPQVVEQAVARVSEAPGTESWSKKLRDCLGRLSRRARLALERRYVYREKPAAIAAAMSWEPSSVYVLLSRSKQALLKCLQSGADAVGGRTA